MSSKIHKVMTIVNVTPDSFFDGSRTMRDEDIELRIATAVEQGADIIDIGGYSTRPQATEISLAQETERVCRGVEALRKIAPQMPFSIDTFRSGVVRSVVERFGRCTVNDISAGAIDPEIIDIAAQYELPYILMHSAVTSPSNLHPVVDYMGDVVGVVRDFLLSRAENFKAKGIKEIILDPGFGFSKSVDENYALLKGLRQICSLGYPVLAGVSRKSFIYKPLSLTPSEIEAHTAAIHFQALMAGADILRVHDTKVTKEIVKMFENYDRA